MNARTNAARTALFGMLLLAATVVCGAAYLRAVRPQARMAPDFTLLDQNARPFTLSALRGHPVALFFGYTHCEDECPLTLAHLAKAMRSPGAPRDVRVAFITVDPRRDTPAALKRYVGLFDRNFIGLTGTLTALDPVYAAYGTPRQAAPAGRERDDSSVTHGTTIYFVSRDGSIKGFAQWDDGIADIARDFRDFQ